MDEDATLQGQLLAAIGEAIARQRTAILDRDSAVLLRLSEELAALACAVRGAQCAANETPESASGRALRTAHRARERSELCALREQIRVNRALIANGMAISDHFVRCVAEASPAAGLFSGVG